MLNNISWMEFLMGVGIALVIYYLFVGVKYYRCDIKDLLSGKRKPELKTALSAVNEIRNNQDTKPGQQETNGFRNMAEDESAELEQLTGRLKETIQDASRRKVIPEEFRQYLTKILREYPSVKASPLRSSVNELIISECKKYGTIRLKEDEVDVLW